MATVHLHLQNLPPEAGAADIRRFFSKLDIPDGGVQIVGGSKGQAFITFSNHEDLLGATAYDKSYIMGRQILMNLVSGEDIEKIIDNMKHELVPQIRPVEMLPTQQTSQSRELPASRGMAAPQVYTPPMEFPAHSNHPPWKKRPQEPAPPQLLGYSSSSVYTGGEPKRMRLSSQLPDEGRYYSNTHTLSAERGSETLQIELEKERRRVQEMKDVLDINKERIERLKQGTKDEGNVTIPRTNLLMGEGQTPHIAGSGAEWLRWQSQLQSQQPRYQYQTEQVPAAYGNQYRHEEPNYPGPTPYYGDQRYSGQNEGYNQGTARYPGPSREYPERMLSHKQKKKQKRATKMYEDIRIRNEGYHPKLPGPIPNYKDQQPPGVIPEHPKEKLTKNQRKKLNKARRLLEEKSKTSADLMMSPIDLRSSHHGFVKVSNVDHTVTATEVRQFFEGYQISPGGLKMKKNDDQGTFTVYIEFVEFNDAQNCCCENKRQLNGREVTVEVVSASDFDAQEGTNIVHEDPVSGPLQSKMLTQKSATPKAPKKLQAPWAPKRKALVRRASSPYSGSIKQTLYFIGLRSLPDDTTAFSVWEKFGGSTGRSVGVLLLDKGGYLKHKEAYVAYENYYDRNSEIPLHEGAKDWIDRGVYVRFSDFSQECKMFKTTPTGEDVEISDDEKAMLGQKFLLKTFRTKATHMTDKERESEQPLLNGISRSLFDITSTDTNEQVNIPDSSETFASGPCYLRLDCLPPDLKAVDVWDWFGGALGPCLHVTLTKWHGKEAQKTKSAYVAFKDGNSVNAEMYKYKQSKTMTVQEASEEMANPCTIVLDSTDKVVKRATEVSSPYSGRIKQALYFTCMKCLPEDATASSVWQKFRGSTGLTAGVLLLDNKELGAPSEAYVAYENYYDRNAEIPCFKGVTDWMDKAVYTKFANAQQECKMYKTTPTGEDVQLSDDEKAMIGQKFLLDSSRTHSAHMTETERESEQSILNEISRSLFDITSTEVNQQVNIPNSVENPSSASGPCYLRLECLPPDVTAREVWDWFGATSGPCFRVTLTKVYGYDAVRLKVGYVAFKDLNSCNAETYKYDQSKIMTEQEVFEEMGNGGLRVVESTEELVTREEQQVGPNSEASIHVLKIKDIGSTLSSSKLWTGWFGGKKGPAQAVTIMDNGRTRAAFVVFRDLLTCKAQKAKHQFSEVTSETEMKRQFARCPTNGPPDNSIYTSNAFGDRIMSKRERAELKARFYNAKEEEKVRTSQHTSDSKEDSEEKQANINSEKANLASTTSKPEEHSGSENRVVKQANVSEKEAGETSNGMSTENAASTLSKPAEQMDTEDTAEIQASEGNKSGTVSKPEENTDREDITEPKSIAGTGLTPCIGGPETKFFLKIPGVTQRITSGKIWSWFGGRPASVPSAVPRVTVVPKVRSLLGQAYVEFTDAAACDKALAHYQGSKVMPEKDVLFAIADHALKSSKDILQSSVLGVDRALTVEERELIIEKVYPKENTENKDAEEKQASNEEGGDASSHTSDRKEGSELRDPEPTGDAEKVQSTETKCFLQIPNLSENITACKIWSWFGGVRGPLPGVTLVQQAAGMKKDAYVEFKDAAARNSVKLQYKDSVDLDEQTMLRTLAEACTSNAEIFQSSTRGRDRLLTPVERELIINQMFPDTIQGDTPSERAHPEGHLSSGTSLLEQATEDVPMYKKRHYEEGALKAQLPRLLQKSEYEYLHLTELRPEVTAFMLSMQYRPCCGVTLIKNSLGQSVAAYIAFESDTNPKANVWHKTRDRELAALGLDYEIYEDTGRLGDRLITLKERQQLKYNVGTKC